MRFLVLATSTLLPFPPRTAPTRSPCPGLNTLANHAFIPRNGRNVTVRQCSQAAEEVFGLSYELITDVQDNFEEMGFVFLTAMDVDGVDQRMFQLADLHNHPAITHSASLFRQDATISNPFPSFGPFLFEGLVAAQKDYDMGVQGHDANATTHTTWEGLLGHARNRIQYSHQNNAAFDLDAPDGRGDDFVRQLVRDLFFLHVFDVDPTFKRIALINLHSFAGPNRIPEGFVPRQELGLPLVVKDDLTQAMQYFAPRVVHSVSESTITPAECMMGMSALQLDLTQFQHYDKWFRPDSIMILPQAGEYHGPQSMHEYFAFATEDSPYVLERQDIHQSAPRLKSIHQVDGICSFTSISTQRFVLDPEHASDTTLLVAAMNRIEYNFRKNYVKGVYVHFTDDWYKLVFGDLLHTENTHKFICSISTSDRCPDTNVGMGMEECMQKLEDLPVLTEGAWFDGKDYGCRALHAVLAEFNDKHCPHISFEPQLDRDNKTKCQQSAHFHPEDFFDEDDLKDFMDYIETEESLIESTTGYKLLSTKPEKSTTYYVIVGGVVPLVIFLVVFLVTRRCQPPDDIDESKTSDSKPDPGTSLFANKLLKFRIVLGTVVASFFLVFGLAGVVIWAIARNHPEWAREEQENRLEDKYRGKSTLVLESAPQALLTDQQFRVYTGFVVWLTVLIAGLGLEIFVWYHFLQFWCRVREGLWRFSQLMFPLFLVTSLGLALHQEFWSLPILVVGLWKFGFPETFMYLYLGLFSTSKSRLHRASDFLNGIGTAIHHGAASLIISQLVVGTIPASRYVLDAGLILVIQHWMALLAYVNVPLYSAIEMTLEFYFEWLVMSGFGQIYYLHWTTALGAGVMVFAHWIYLTAAVLGMFATEQASHGEDNVHKRGQEMMRGATATKKPSLNQSNTYTTSPPSSLRLRRSAPAIQQVSVRNLESLNRRESTDILNELTRSTGMGHRRRTMSMKLADQFLQHQLQDQLDELDFSESCANHEEGTPTRLDARLHQEPGENRRKYSS